MNYFLSQKTSNYQRPGTYLIGLEFDGTACFRKGARYGPKAIRAVSEGIEDYSPYLNKSLEQIKNFYDLGDIGPKEQTGDQAITAMEKEYHQIFAESSALEQSKIVTLGGEHSISLIPLRKYLQCYPNLVVIQLDAHADLRDGYGGFHYSHASIICRILEHFRPQHELIQYGIRSGTKQEFQLMEARKTLYRSQEEFLHKIHQIDPKRPIYLTFDLDYFDPCILPGTGTPEPGGENFHSFLKLIKILDSKNFVGADIVELSPELDPSNVSSIVATKVVREIILALN